MKCSDAALIFWTHIVLETRKTPKHSNYLSSSATSVCYGGVGCAPLIESLRFQRVDAVDVRDVEEGLVAGWVGRHFHQDLVEEQRLETEDRK